MIATTYISDVRTKKVLGVLVWIPKGSKRKGHKLSSFTVYVNDDNMEKVEKTTRSKAELLIKHIYRSQSIKAIKTERDLEILVNIFVVEHSPYILFNGNTTFNISRNYEMTIEDFKTDMAQGTGARSLSKGYFKRKVKQDMKDFIKSNRK